MFTEKVLFSRTLKETNNLSRCGLSLYFKETHPFLLSKGLQTEYNVFTPPFPKFTNKVKEKVCTFHFIIKSELGKSPSRVTFTFEVMS